MRQNLFSSIIHSSPIYSHLLYHYFSPHLPSYTCPQNSPIQPTYPFLPIPPFITYLTSILFLFPAILPSPTNPILSTLLWVSPQPPSYNKPVPQISFHPLFLFFSYRTHLRLCKLESNSTNVGATKKITTLVAWRATGCIRPSKHAKADTEAGCSAAICWILSNHATCVSMEVEHKWY